MSESNYEIPSMEPVKQARKKAQAAGKRATEFAARGKTLVDELRKALGKRYGETDIPEDTAKARSEFLQAPSQARADIAEQVRGGTIYSPSQQQAIQSAKMASALVPLAGQNLVQSAAMGSLEDMIGAGTRAYQAKVAMQQGLADLAQQSYQNILGEWQARQQAALQRAKEARLSRQLGLAESTTFPDLERQLMEAKIASKRSAGGGTGLGAGGIIGELFSPIQEPTVPEPTESKPSFIPSERMQGNVTGVIHSSEGEWVFDKENQEWVPVIF